MDMRFLSDCSCYGVGLPGECGATCGGSYTSCLNSDLYANWLLISGTCNFEQLPHTSVVFYFDYRGNANCSVSCLPLTICRFLLYHMMVICWVNFWSWSFYSIFYHFGNPHRHGNQFLRACEHWCFLEKPWEGSSVFSYNSVVVKESVWSSIGV